MFKLPLLQPQLTGANGVESRHGSISRYQPFLSSSRSHRGDGAEHVAAGSNTETRDWQAQAKDITSDVTSSDKYKSLALHAEVKLAEALERCTRICPTVYSTEGEEKPNKLRTAVCCQLLGEFAELCGPFSGVLRNIRDELVKSVYSGLYVSEKGLLVFDQQPWFSVAERLEREKEVMMAEKAKFEAMLQEQQAIILRIEEQMGTYQRSTAAAQLEAAALKSRLEKLEASEESARLDAKTGREELKRLRKEWLRMKDELEGEKAAHAAAKEQLVHDTRDMQIRLRAMNDALAIADTQAQEAMQQAAMRLPMEAVSEMQAALETAQTELTTLKNSLKLLEAEREGLLKKLGTLTPKSNWKELRGFGIEESQSKRTQELVNAAAEKLASYAAANEAMAVHAMDLEALLAPEPAPRDITLAIATDSSAYFITEGQDDGSQDKPTGSLSAEGLGMGPHVPRCLRWPEGHMIQQLTHYNTEQTEALALAIMKAKQVHDILHEPEHLQSFLYTYLSTQLPATGIEHSNLTDLASALALAKISDSSASNGQPSKAPIGRHATLARQAYSLYHAVTTHANKSPLLGLFWQVLTGQLPEAAWADQQLLFGSVLMAARAAATTSTAVGAALETPLASPRQVTAEGGSSKLGEEALVALNDPLVPTPVMLQALERLFVDRPVHKLAKLKDAYSHAVHPAGIQLSKLEALLAPVALGYPLKEVAMQLSGEVAAAATAASVAGASTTTGGGRAGVSEAAPAKPASSTSRALAVNAGAPASQLEVQGVDTASSHQQLSEDTVAGNPVPLFAQHEATLQNEFVRTVMQQHLDHVLAAQAAALAAIANAPAGELQHEEYVLKPRSSATQPAAAGQNEGVLKQGEHVWEQGPHGAEVVQQLGVRVQAQGLLHAMVEGGVAELPAAAAVSAAVCGSSGLCMEVPPAGLQGVLTSSGLQVWMGLAQRKLMANSLLGQGSRNLQQLLEWMATLKGEGSDVTA